MNKLNLSRVDLNLFVVFAAIYRHGSLTKAATELCLSQPAVSHALARLREQFHDQLFERIGRSMRPTPKAKSIYELVNLGLHHFEASLAQDNVFEPALSNRAFTLAARDLMEVVALPKLMAEMGQEAPHIRLKTVRLPRKDIASQLEIGAIDFAVDVFLPMPENIEQINFGVDRLVILMRQDNPYALQEWGLETYLQALHVLVSSRVEGQSIEDFELAKLGKHRKINLRCQNYHAAIDVVRQTNLMVSLPQSFVRNLQGFVVRELPIAIDPIKLYLYWHKKTNNDLATQWLKQKLLASFSDLA